MSLQEVVILNPRRPAKGRRRKSAAKKRSKVKTMARRRKTTTRRRKSSASRKSGGRRRRASSKRRRSTTRRKSPARRRKTTKRRRKAGTRRRRSTTRRKSPAKRRKSTTRRRKKSPARRRKSTSRRRKTTTRRRRKSPARRRKSGTRRRRSTARRRSSTKRRRSSAKRRSSARRMTTRKMSVSGFRQFVMDHLAARAAIVTTIGLALPALGVIADARLGIRNRLSSLPMVGNFLATPWGGATLGTVVTAGMSYAAYGLGLLNRNEAIAANTIAMVLMFAAAGQSAGVLPGQITSLLPLNGMHSMAGYGGSYISGYSGYLGSEHVGETYEEPMQLYGVGGAGRVNVF